MAWCRWCGELASRCNCASSTTHRGSQTIDALRKEANMMPEKDRWGKRYTERRLSSSPSTSPTFPQESVFPNSRGSSTCPSPSPLSVEEEVMEDVLSHAFESVLAPKNALEKWSCAACFTRFKPDAVLYPANDKLFCRACFAKDHAKGTCKGCSKAVLGDAPYIRQGTDLYHSMCCKCTYCSTNVADNPIIDLKQVISCEACFMSAAWKRPPVNMAIPSSSAPKPVAQSRRWQSSVVQQPAIEHLKTKFARAGLQRPKETPTIEDRATKAVDLAHLDLRKSFEPTQIDSCHVCHSSLLSCASNGDTIVKLTQLKVMLHGKCFVCAICKAYFDKTSYTVLDDGAFAHPSCAPALPIPAVPVRPAVSQSLSESKVQRTTPLPLSSAPNQQSVVRPGFTRANSSYSASPKFGCPGCQQPVLAMDNGVSSGLVRWHLKCVKCVSCQKQMDGIRLNAKGENQCVSCRLCR